VVTKEIAGAQKNFSRSQRISIVVGVLSGDTTRLEVCGQHSIDETELDFWIIQHGGDRLVELDEFRMPHQLNSNCYGLWVQQRRLESLLKSKTQELCGLKQLARQRGIL
jgi:transposase-like protein